jgi:hypothetical protein
LSCVQEFWFSIYRSGFKNSVLRCSFQF